MNLLDVLIDHVEAGGTVFWIEVETPCAHPDLSSITSYRNHGCRCPRCRAGHYASNLRYRHHEAGPRGRPKSGRRHP